MGLAIRMVRLHSRRVGLATRMVDFRPRRVSLETRMMGLQSGIVGLATRIGHISKLVPLGGNFRNAFINPILEILEFLNLLL